MADQMELPGMPFRKTTIRVAQSSAPEQIVQLYSVLRGPVVHFGKNLKHAKQILDAGYSLEEILECIRWMHDHDLYGEWSWGLVFVGKKMPEFRRDRGKTTVCSADVIEVPEGWSRGDAG